MSGKQGSKSDPEKKLDWAVYWYSIHVYWPSIDCKRSGLVSQFLSLYDTCQVGVKNARAKKQKSSLFAFKAGASWQTYLFIQIPSFFVWILFWRANVLLVQWPVTNCNFLMIIDLQVRMIRKKCVSKRIITKYNSTTKEGFFAKWSKSKM